MRIAVCDDRSRDAERLCALLSGHNVFYFPSAEALLTVMEELDERFDLYLLDIFMDGMDGLALAKRIRAMENEALLCFVSTSEEFYREAYDLYAFQYLVKPVKPQVLDELLRQAAARLGRKRERSVLVNIRGRTVTIPYGHLLYISSQDHSLNYQCRDGTFYQERGRLDAVLARLDATIFCRCHQSYVVNLRNVTELCGNEFLCGEFRVPISRRYADAKEKYRRSLFEEME